MIDDIVGGLLTQHTRAEFRIETSDVECWSKQTGYTKLDLFNRMAMQLATGFHEKHLTFDFCDVVINGTVGHLTQDS